MTALIKASTEPDRLEAVVPFSLRTVADTKPGPTLDMLLQAKVAALEAELADLKRTFPGQLERAREEGAREALKSRSDLEEKQLKQLGAGIGKALTVWQERLVSLEILSAKIASTILKQIFADGNERALAVASCLRQRFAMLEAHAILRVRVSAADFADADHLAFLSAELGGNVEILSDEGLESGACILDLKLGHLELGPQAQWGRVAELLEAFASEASSA
jgi:type III secretion protein L